MLINGQTKCQNSTREVYLQVFVNFAQNERLKLLPIAKFTHNNAKNISTSHISYKSNCCYHSKILYKDNVNPCSLSKTADKLSTEVQKIIIVCQKNFCHAQKLQKKFMTKTLSYEAMCSKTKFD